MDHQHFAQLLGNYGEFLGAIAVVATLTYLAQQIKQNTKATRLAARSHIVEGTMALRGRTIDNSVLRAAILKVRRGEKLNEDEEFIIHQHTDMQLRNWEYQHYLYVNGN